MFKLQKRETLFSRLTIILSSICIIHCLSMPVLILLLPALATFLSSTLELILILSIFPLSIAAFLPRWLKHRNYKRVFTFAGGLSLILLTQLFFHPGHSSTPYGPTDILGLAGFFAGVLIVAGVIYLQNRHTHTCKNPAHKH